MPDCRHQCLIRLQCSFFMSFLCLRSRVRAQCRVHAYTVHIAHYYQNGYIRHDLQARLVAPVMEQAAQAGQNPRAQLQSAAVVQSSAWLKLLQWLVWLLLLLLQHSRGMDKLCIEQSLSTAYGQGKFELREAVCVAIACYT